MSTTETREGVPSPRVQISEPDPSAPKGVLARDDLFRDMVHNTVRSS